MLQDCGELGCLACYIVRRLPPILESESVWTYADEMCRTNDAGDVTLDGCIPRALATAIESARIIHLAQYKSNPAKDCLLTVKMTRPLAQDFKIKGANATFVWKPMPTTAHGRPQEFFEASLSSVRMEQALQENASLHFGNEVAWQTTDVQHESSIEEIFQIGFGMVALMDKIGSVGSEEARGPRFSRTGPAPKTEQQQGGGYW